MQKKEIIPNIVEVLCPRCNKTHMSFTEEISGLLFEVCNHCMTDKEKEDQGKIEREALFLKYN